MHVIADTDQLVKEGVLTTDQAEIIQDRARATMITLAINVVLCAGIFAATGGLIFWLATPVSVAVGGVLMLVLGLGILSKRSETLAMFGNAATLIGAGMLLGGAAIELVDKHQDIAGWILAPVGGVLLVALGWRMKTGALSNRFVMGALILMALALHIGGIEWLSQEQELVAPWRNIEMLYYAALMAGVGMLIDLRFVTALSLAPFAQALETGSSYFHAAYVFYSPESTLSIVQMALLIALCLWAARTQPERIARHLRTLVILAFVVANMCALVGSLWGDVVGEYVWGSGRYSDSRYSDWDDFFAAREAFRASALKISEGVYSILWGGALIVILIWAARSSRRGLFNGALTFAGIHAYTQLFESFGDEPLAYVIGGLALIPVAWAAWQLNRGLLSQNRVT